MPSYRTTADWVVAQLRKVDWVTRHNMVERLKRTDFVQVEYHLDFVLIEEHMEKS